MELSVKACLVVTVLTQWLTRLLCKKLLQLMTSEALCMLHRKIPSSFIQHYLNHQHHFSLKALLESQCTLLDSPKYDPFYVRTFIVLVARFIHIVHTL